MDQSAICRLHVSRVIHHPRLAVERAFDQYVVECLEARPQSQRWRMSAGAFTTDFVGDGQVSSPGPVSAYRRVYGWLGTGRWTAGTAIELEITPWSGTRCQIGIRPRRLVAVSRQARYFEAAVATTELLVDALSASSWRSIEQALEAGNSVTQGRIVAPTFP